MFLCKPSPACRARGGIVGKQMKGKTTQSSNSVLLMMTVLGRDDDPLYGRLSFRTNHRLAPTSPSPASGRSRMCCQGLGDKLDDAQMLRCWYCLLPNSFPSSGQYLAYSYRRELQIPDAFSRLVTAFSRRLIQICFRSIDLCKTSHDW